jgi:tRNA-splicing ligase RtcB (3'-phosphate/5'-hydroxy nucleic acid ligase)
MFNYLAGAQLGTPASTEEKMITAKELLALGMPESKAIAVALEVATQHATTYTKEELLILYTNVIADPDMFLNDELAGGIAKELVALRSELIELKAPVSYSIYGKEHIEEGAIKQMEVAVCLPVAVSGALMPDAHQGYGLPIGGVLATENAVIPYGVGVDIGCRMCLSIYDITETDYLAHESQFKRELIAQTKFGAGAGFHGKDKADHEVLSNNVFKTIPFVKNLHDKAYSQLGSSGGGNHFVEWGIMEMLNDDAELNVPKGKYLALLSHSGSRGLGATIAGHYTKLAKQLCKLPQEAANLAYLDLNTQEGQEYWLAMNLAGDYASACHEVIHNKLTVAIKGNLLARVENHHNFAWKEMHDGKEVIVHRKGATPASAGVMGIIPGSMTAPGFLVRGKGETASINSASHGAGRQLSRTKAIKSITRDEMRKMLKDNGVTLIGGGLDEAPNAYKDIRTVMASQTELVDAIAMFSPKMVRMADDGSRED